MYRRVKQKAKTGVIIFSFSLLITIVFTLLLFRFQNTIQTDTNNDRLYLLSHPDYNDIIKNKGNLQLDASKFIEKTDYLNSQLKKLLPFSLLFLLALFLLSLILWHVLNRIQKRQTIEIANQIDAASIDYILSNEPILATSYQNLKQKFDYQLNDYKRLYAYLSHEQKNAIAILKANLELSNQKEHKQTIDIISDGIEDILTLSENESDTPMATVDVSLICAEVFDSYHKISDTISFEYDGNDTTEISAKSRWIYRAVANVLDNAIKYGNGNPIILSVYAKHNSVVVAVKDHGIGIEEAKQESIFNEHYRINELNKDGYGIGLSLVSHVCDLCGGFVSVESELNKGSTFYLAFPQN